MKCPKCGHETYSKKWGTCTAEGCSLNHSEPRSYFAREAVVIVGTVTQVTEPWPRAKPVTRRDEKSVTHSKRGPQATYTSPAERQRAYRARKKAGANA